jgi:PAS domain S-box-containing protein
MHACPALAEPSETAVEFEKLLADLFARLINPPADRLDSEIEAGLAHICDALDIDRAILWQGPEHDPHSMIATHVCDRLPTPPGRRGDEIRLVVGLDAAAFFPGLVDRLHAGEIVRIRRISDIPDAAARERDALRRFGTTAYLSIPFVENGVVDALELDMRGRERDWPDSLVQRLRFVAQVFGNALARRRADRALKASEERLQLAALSAEAGVWDLNVETGQLWATPTTKALYGFAPDAEVDGSQVIERIHPEDRERVRAETVASPERSSLTTIDFRIVLPDGRVRWIRARWRPSGAADAPSRLAGVSLDITALKEAELQVRENEARLSIALQIARLGSYETREGVNSIVLDDRLRELLAVGTDDVRRIWNFWVDHIHEDDRERVMDLSTRLRTGGVDAGAIEYRYVRPDGTTIWLHHASRVLDRSPDGCAARLVGVVQDVTERNARELELHEALDEVVRLRDELHQENLYLRQEVKAQQGLREVLGTSPAMVRVMEQAAQVAPTSSTVLLLGETGTGKERFASFIHDLSPRRGRPMVRVNCSAIPSTLIESELFGREKGAYTGALSKQIGRFELANGSTLFLDEIGELPPEIQVKLLRVLQERHIERLGNPRPVPVDVRIIAASNRNLEQAIADGTFRRDLYYRLAVFPITLPPLRERLEDLPLLVEALVEELSALLGKRIEAVSRQSLEDLARYGWPGNVRELRNVIERAIILASGPVLRIDLPSRPAAAPPTSQTGAPSAAAPVDASSIQSVEREHLLKILRETGWRIRGPHGAAEILKLKPTTLETRMARLGIRRPGKARVAP